MTKKKTDEKIDAMKMSDEQLQKTHDKFRADMREKFDKWMTVYDEPATPEDVAKAKDEFDAECAKYANQTYTIVENNAVKYAQLLKRWNETLNHWEKGRWKGVLQFDKIINDFLNTHEDKEDEALEVDYATLIYLYESMSNPSGDGLESARFMAELEDYDFETGEKRENDNFVTYSHVLQNILNTIQYLTNVDKKLKLMRERINIETAGIKFDWKITELEEFIELHNAWLGEAVPDNEQLQNMQ